MKKLLFLWAGILLARGGCASVATTKPLGLPIWAVARGLGLVNVSDDEYADF
jgi:hypothetical protein